MGRDWTVFVPAGLLLLVMGIGIMCMSGSPTACRLQEDAEEWFIWGPGGRATNTAPTGAGINLGMAPPPASRAGPAGGLDAVATSELSTTWQSTIRLLSLDRYIQGTTNPAANCIEFTVASCGLNAANLARESAPAWARGKAGYAEFACWEVWLNTGTDSPRQGWWISHAGETEQTHVLTITVHDLLATAPECIDPTPAPCFYVGPDTYLEMTVTNTYAPAGDLGDLTVSLRPPSWVDGAVLGLDARAWGALHEGLSGNTYIQQCITCDDRPVDCGSDWQASFHEGLGCAWAEENTFSWGIAAPAPLTL